MPSCLATPGLVPYPRGTRSGFFACSGTVWVEGATKPPNARPVSAWRPVLGLVVAGEWLGLPVPRLFLCVGALHPIRRQCTSSERVQCP